MRESSIPTLFSVSRAAAHAALARFAEEPGAALPLLLVDATCGNGHDTLFLAQTLENLDLPGKVLAFDVQEQAIASARTRLAGANLSLRAEFILQGHEHVARHVPPGQGAAVAMFNLGYLPGSDKRVVTRAETTLAAFNALAGSMLPGGMLSVHAYMGHEGGAAEGEAVDAWFGALLPEQWIVARYEIRNKARNREVLHLAQRL